MDQDFVERRDSGFYIVGSRVPIYRIVWEYHNGEDPETIRSHYPTLSLEQVNARSNSYLNRNSKWKGLMRNAGVRRMLTSRRIQRFPT